MSTIPFRSEPTEGMVFRLNSPTSIREAIDAAFDYRGDVTVELHSGERIVGYVFHRDWTRGDGLIDVLPQSGETPRRILVSNVIQLTLSGKDPAAGKTWESWIARVKEAESRGEIAELYPDEAA